VHAPIVLFNSRFTLRALVSGTFGSITEAVPNKSPIVSIVAFYTLVPKAFATSADLTLTSCTINLNGKLWKILEIDDRITGWTGTVNNLTM
jgi:hypothetical protein